MSHYAELGGLRTWYEELGDGEPLVALHPGGADARAWGPQLDALTARFRVFTSIIVDFLTIDPVPTIAPVRRTTAS